MAFNSDVYAWKDIKVVYLGRTLSGIQGVKYERSTEKEPVYGRGSKPYAIQSGNQSITGTLMLLQDELEALTTAVSAVNPDLNINDISADIVVSYGEGNNAKTDIIVGVEFTKYTKGMEQNDKYMRIEIPFIALDINEGR